MSVLVGFGVSIGVSLILEIPYSSYLTGSKYGRYLSPYIFLACLDGVSSLGWYRMHIEGIAAKGGVYTKGPCYGPMASIYSSIGVYLWP